MKFQGLWLLTTVSGVDRGGGLWGLEPPLCRLSKYIILLRGIWRNNYTTTPLLLKPRPVNVPCIGQSRPFYLNHAHITAANGPKPVEKSVEEDFFSAINSQIFSQIQVQSSFFGAESSYLSKSVWWAWFTLSRLEVRRDAGESTVKWENPAEIGILGQSTFVISHSGRGYS